MPDVPPDPADDVEALEPEVYRFELAKPDPGIPDATPPGIDIGDRSLDPESGPERFDIGDAYRFDGDSFYDALSAATNVGDFNDDGFDDFLVSDADYSYLMIGPLDLAEARDPAEYAAMVISHAIFGTPALTHGNVDAERGSDLIFSHSIWNGFGFIYSF